MSNQRIVGKMVCRVVLCWVLLVALYFIHEIGHLVLFNLFSNTTQARIMFDGGRLVTGNLVRLEPLADRVMRAGGLLATAPTIVLINKRTPFLGMAALVWIVYGIFEAFILVI